MEAQGVNTFCTARVAPEKAVFRPALPLHSLPGLDGTTMTKMTYAEQLKHPFWQKKRLEVLEDARWRCECCEDATRTLHVHHKRYVKGRMAWEYEREELASLCEACHEQAGEVRNRFLHLLCLVESFPKAGVTESDLLALCEAYLGMAAGGQDLGEEHPYEYSGRRTRHSNAGALAANAFNSDLSEQEICELGDLVISGDGAPSKDLRQLLALERERIEADVAEYLRNHPVGGDPFKG